MKTGKMTTLAVGAVVTAMIGSAAQAQIVFNRAADWVPGTTGQVSGTPGPTGPSPWVYEYTVGGGASNSATPWYNQPSAPMVWDDNWFSTGRGVWAQGDNTNPPVDQTRYAHNVGANAINFASLVKFQPTQPNQNQFDLTGNLRIVWDGKNGVGYPTPVDVIVGKRSSAGSTTTVLMSTTVFKPNPFASVGDFIDVPVNLPMVQLGAGESLVLTHRGRNTVSPGGWITMYDNLNLALIPSPGAAALLGFGGILASRRRR